MIMTQINLLPWREELRQEQKKQFAVMAVMTCVLAAAIVALIHFQIPRIIQSLPLSEILIKAPMIRPQ